MRTSREGIALLLVLFALAIAGTLLTAAFYETRIDDDAARVGLRISQLEGTNQQSVAIMLADWDSAARYQQPVASSESVPVPLGDGHARTMAWMTRLSAYSYLVTVRSADARDPTLAAGASTLIQIGAPYVPLLATVIANGDVGPADGVRIVIADSGTGSSCEEAGPDPPAFAVPPGHSAPPPYVATSVAADDSTYRWFGDVSLDTLLARATQHLPTATPVPAPSTAIALASGDLVLAGGAGRGMLIVLGTLTLRGPLAFSGIILAFDGILVESGESSINGLVLVAGGSTSAFLVKPGAHIDLRYDPCAVTDAGWHAGRARSRPDWTFFPTP